MLALAVAGVVERHVLEQLDVAGQADAHVGAFDQVVAEKSFGREAVADAIAERAHVVDGFAVEDGFTEEVLLGVGDGLAIGIGAGGIGEDAREVGGGGAGQ